MKVHDNAVTPWRVVLFFICLGFFAPMLSAADGKSGSLVNCDVQSGVCTRMLDGRTVTLEMLPKPVKAMADLTFRVAVGGLSDNAHPYIDLNMPAMNMGANRIALKPAKPGVYEGRGVIVRCRSGDRTWRATIVLPGMGSIEFVFDVIY